MTEQITRLISVPEIKAAVDEWPDKAADTFRDLVAARNAVLGQAQFDPKIVAELARILAKAPKGLVEIASPIVQSLTERFNDARGLITQLAASKRLQGRLAAIYSLSPALDESFLRAILSDLLADRSRKVRQMATDWIARNQKRGLLPLVVKALEKEVDPGLRAYMAREMCLLDKGYFVETKSGKTFVTVMNSAGRAGGFIQTGSMDDFSDEQAVQVFLKNQTR
jgi:hypothetical protein